MLIEDKVYFSRYDCYDENFAAKVIQCDPATGVTRDLKIQKEGFKVINRMAQISKNKLLIAAEGLDSEFWINICSPTTGKQT